MNLLQAQYEIDLATPTEAVRSPASPEFSNHISIVDIN